MSSNNKKNKKARVPKSQALAPRLCQRIIDDVVANMRQPFLDDGVGQQTLDRLAYMWRSKLSKKKSFDQGPAISPTPPPAPGMDTELSSSSSCRRILNVRRIKLGTAKQLDGANDNSDDESVNGFEEADLDDDGDDDDGGDDNDDGESEKSDEEDIKEEPLNSGDDVTDDEDTEVKFDTENVMACQYDVVNRSRNKWKFALRDGIMKMNDKEFVFKRADGEAMW